MHNRKIGNYTKLENFKRNTYTYNRVYISQRPHNLRNNWILCWFMLITFLFVYNLTFIKAVRMNEDTTNKIEENGIVAYQNSRFKAHMKVPMSFSDHILPSAMSTFFSFYLFRHERNFNQPLYKSSLGLRNSFFFQMKDKALFQPEVLAK